MADAVVDELGAFVKRLLRRLPLGRIYPGTVKLQGSVGAPVDVLPDDASELGSGGFSGIPLALGLPGFTVLIPNGTRLRQWWDSWNPSKPRAGLFDQGGPVTEIRFDGGTKAVARVDDTVDCGTLTGTAPSGGGPVTFTWTPPGGGAPTVSTSINIIGAVTSGNTKFRA